jgi:hypothetical protein
MRKIHVFCTCNFLAEVPTKPEEPDVYDLYPAIAGLREPRVAKILVRCQATVSRRSAPPCGIKRPAVTKDSAKLASDRRTRSRQAALDAKRRIADQAAADAAWVNPVWDAVQQAQTGREKGDQRPGSSKTPSTTFDRPPRYRYVVDPAAGTFPDTGRPRRSHYELILSDSESL